MCKSKTTWVQVSPSWGVHEDWQVSILSWSSLCWDSTFSESSFETWDKRNVWTSS